MNRDCIGSEVILSKGNNSYKITLENTDGTTWQYSVEKLRGKDISNWALELCKETEVVRYSPGGADVGSPNHGVGHGNCLNKNNPIGCIGDDDPIVENQIKWNTDGGTFNFELDECHAIGCVRVAIKAGDECFCGTIQGPICEPCQPEPGRGILFI